MCGKFKVLRSSIERWVPNIRFYRSVISLSSAVSMLGMFVVGTITFMGMNSAQASELAIEINSGVDSKSLIAVSPFRWGGPGLIPKEVSQIVEQDLYRSGLFKIQPRAQMLSRPTQIEEVVFREWRALKNDYLLIGSVLPTVGPGAKFSYRFALFDVVREAVLFDHKGGGNSLRGTAHHISDTVFEKITGIPGAFSTQILYVTVEGRGSERLYRLKRADADGHRVVTLFESGEPILSPAWSPNGQQVAYVSYHKGRKPGVFIQDIRTGAQKLLAQFSGLNGAPDWSPDGRQMAITLSKEGNPEIYLIDMQTQKLTRLTKHYGIDTEPRWMPDGKSLLFTSNRGGGPQIYQLDISTKDVQRLTFEGKYNARGDISADGRFLTMVHSDKGKFKIAVKDLKKGTFRILTESSLDESPSIAPNAAMVIYATRDTNGEGVLSAVSLDGEVQVKLPARAGEVREPAWSPYLR